MNKLILFPIVFVAFLALFTSPALAQIQLTPEDNEAKRNIISNTSNAVDHHYDEYDLILGSVKGDNSTFTIYNKTGGMPEPPIVCGPGTHEENDVCVPDVPPTDNDTDPVPDNDTDPDPDPVPDNDTDTDPESEYTDILAVGDLKGMGTINSMKELDAFLHIALGDMFYKSNLDAFIPAWNGLPNQKACTIGNHDSEEDGSATITRQAKQYCGDIWQKKVAGGTTLIIGWNSNGNVGALTNTAVSFVKDSTLMGGVKNVILASHKPCETFPGAHHSVESNVKKFCDTVDKNLPASINLVKLSGHNHESASKSDGSAFVAGGGGAGQRECGTGNGWNFCNNDDNAFLRLRINNDSGEINTQFINNNGEVLN